MDYKFEFTLDGYDYYSRTTKISKYYVKGLAGTTNFVKISDDEFFTAADIVTDRDELAATILDN